MKPNFASVTELPGLGATREQRSMLYTRYHLAATYSAGKDVLEVGCGAGLGLGYLAQQARSVTGVDIDETNLRVAAESYRGRQRIVLRRQNAERLEYADDSFDTLLLFEAVYYLHDPACFVSEARRVLRPGGRLIICTVNRRWRGFNPSPYSVRYFDADELRGFLAARGFDVHVFAAFPARTDSLVKLAVSLIRSGAVRLGLIPRTMQGKNWLKRLFYGGLTTLEREVHEQMAPLAQLVELPPHADASQFKVLYAVATTDKLSTNNFAA